MSLSRSLSPPISLNRSIGSSCTGCEKIATSPCEFGYERKPSSKECAVMFIPPKTYFSIVHSMPRGIIPCTAFAVKKGLLRVNFPGIKKRTASLRKKIFFDDKILLIRLKALDFLLTVLFCRCILMKTSQKHSGRKEYAKMSIVTIVGAGMMAYDPFCQSFNIT